METIERIYNGLVGKIGSRHEVGSVIPEIENYSTENKINIEDIHTSLRKFIRQKENKSELDLIILEAINVMKISRIIDRVHKR